MAEPAQTFGLPPQESAALTARVTLLSVATAVVLVAIKAAVWWMSGSVAVLASLADSALDLVASLVTFFAVRYAVAPPDAEHRYGHGKAEAFASLLQAGLVFASAALIGREAIQHILKPDPLAHETWAIAVMVVSTIITFGLITAQGQVLKKTASVAVQGDRAHYAADLASNVVALIGIGASALVGWAGADAIAALIVAALLLWGAVGVFREASNQLMDRELPDEQRARIVELVRQDPHVTAVRRLRTRASGPFVHMQLDAELDPDLTLEAAHEVVLAAERRLLAEFPAADILIHIDPRGRNAPHEGPFAQAPRRRAVE